ncbi:Uncharacterized protein PBTT_10046 [Plasmodiophora brassicae]|uniref:Uncharacterized protein n=1 Tax=Plasmodiophora brassicae TaxID=37360 RepID=A0A0G4INZ1_PLABS|nr:hypothetical protein PBRA_005575 [Plasmodiophora brassicae]SPR01924.1 unnamed protein product [Plasmodiophora brassicae]
MLSVVMRRVACASRRPWSGAFAGMKTSAIPIAEETSEQYDEYEASWRVKCYNPADYGKDDVIPATMHGTLEWLISSPPEMHLFEETPIIYEATGGPSSPPIAYEPGK